MHQIDPKAIDYLSKGNLMVLRAADTGILLNVSYSEDGLKWTVDKSGRSLYFDKKGNKSSKVYSEKFVPRNHNNISAQLAEFFGVHKGYKLLYHAV